MQPYHEALGLGRQPLGSRTVPSLVSQIADGENGGVMMNEFPRPFCRPTARSPPAESRPATVALNGSEYLELLEASGVTPADFPAIQAVGQQRLWQEVGGAPTPDATEAAIARLQAGDPSFSMAGPPGPTTISWVEGYTNVLEPMNQLSAAFHQNSTRWWSGIRA